MKQELLQLTGGNFTSNRRALDFYPTPKNVTVALMDFLQLPVHLTIWEPACGDFSMSNVFKWYGHNVIETDIIYGDDFLLTHHDADAIITNPPFNLSEKLIKKALPEARIVAMLLKGQYWHGAQRFRLFEKHPPTYVLPLTWRPDFLEKERKGEQKKGSPTMEVAWTVWKRGSAHETIYKPLLNPSKGTLFTR